MVPAPASLRIAQLLESDGPGGAENVVANLSRRLHQTGDAVVVYLPARGQGWLRRQLEGSGVTFEIFDITSPFSPRFARWLRDSFSAHRIDLAHSHEFSFAVYAAWAARRAGIPHVATMHGGRYYVERLRRRVALALALRATAEPVAVSEALKNHLCRDLLLARDRVTVVPNGIAYSPARDPGLRTSLELPASARLILAVGNLYPVKGHKYLIEALARIGERHPDACVAIAGRGDELDPLKGLAASHHLERRVRFLGLRSDIPQLLAASDLFVLPSLSEGLPIAILEAMFAGKCIIASDVGDIAVALGGTGTVVPPGDTEALVAALDAHLSDPKGAARLGAAARERALAEYAVDQMVTRYRLLYQRARLRK